MHHYRTDLLISVELLLSWPLLGCGDEGASCSFIRTFSKATTATLVKSSSILSPIEVQVFNDGPLPFL